MAYTCPFCGMTSHNPNDEREKYCGKCHVFEEDELMRRELIRRGMLAEPAAEESS